MARGGYQRPRNPAPVSGPGQLSRRTDGTAADTQKRLSVPTGADGQWGERAALDAIQSSADLAGSPRPPAVAAGSAAGGPVSPVVALNAPTARPDEDVSAFTPPPGSVPPADVAATAIRRAYFEHPTPELRMLVNRLQAQGR